MLGGHVNIGRVFLLTQDGQVADDVDGVDITSDETDAFLPFFEAFHHFFHAAFDVLGGGSFLDEFVEFLGEFLAGQGLGDDADGLEAVFVRLGAGLFWWGEGGKSRGMRSTL